MSLYEKWLRLWADKPVLDLVESINNNPEIVRIEGYGKYMIGTLYVYLGAIPNCINVGGKWYGGCNNKLVRRAIATALIKQQGK
jgi:hypothetical protein